MEKTKMDLAKERVAEKRRVRVSIIDCLSYLSNKPCVESRCEDGDACKPCQARFVLAYYNREGRLP